MPPPGLFTPGCTHLPRRDGTGCRWPVLGAPSSPHSHLGHRGPAPGDAEAPSPSLCTPARPGSGGGCSPCPMPGRGGSNRWHWAVPCLVSRRLAVVNQPPRGSRTVAPVAVPCSGHEGSPQGLGQAGEGAAQRILGLSWVWLRDRDAACAGLPSLSSLRICLSSPSGDGPLLAPGLCSTRGWWTRAGASPVPAPGRFSLIQQDWSQSNCPARLLPADITPPTSQTSGTLPATQALAAWAVVGSDFGLVPLRDCSKAPLLPLLRAPRAGRWKGIGAGSSAGRAAGFPWPVLA